MKPNKSLIATLFLLTLFGCNTDKNDLIIQDLKNNGVDTSGISDDTDNGGSDNGSSDALGTQKISLTVIIDPSFSETVTRVRARAFTSRSPVVASTWMDLTAGSGGTFTGTYGAAPNPGTPFGIHVEAYNGSTRVGNLAGNTTEYTNNGDGSTILGNVITIDNDALE